MSRKEQLVAALDVKNREEKKLKKLQEDIHAQNTILFDMQVQVKEVIFLIIHGVFCMQSPLICTSKFVQSEKKVRAKFKSSKIVL